MVAKGDICYILSMGLSPFHSKRKKSQVSNTFSRQLNRPNIQKTFTSVMCGFKFLIVHLLDLIVEKLETAHQILPLSSYQ